MEESLLKNELHECVKSFFNVNFSNQKNEEKREQFLIEFDLDGRIHSETNEEIEKRFNRRFVEDIIDKLAVKILPKIMDVPKLDERTKSVRLDIENEQYVSNDRDDEFKTIFELNYHFNTKCKKEILIENLGRGIQYLDLNLDEIFLIFRIKVSNPVKAKQLADAIIKIAKVFLNIDGRGLKKIIFNFTHQVIARNDDILILLKSNTYLSDIISKISSIIAHKFDDRKLEATFNFSSKKNFNDLNRDNQDFFKTVLTGSRTNLNITTNIMNFPMEIKKAIDPYRRSIDDPGFMVYAWALTEADINCKFSMNELEESLFWGPNFPPKFNAFDQDNRFFQGLVKKYSELKDDLPILIRFLELCNLSTGSISAYFNSPLGMISGELKTNGIMNAWEILNSVHSKESK